MARVSCADKPYADRKKGIIHPESIRSRLVRQACGI